MFEFLKRLFGASRTDYAALIKSGAIIIDVRTPQEYASGHITGSVNLPVDQIAHQITKLKDKNRVIITCCASGMRSGSARLILKSKGYKNVYNGGSWLSLRKHTGQ